MIFYPSARISRRTTASGIRHGDARDSLDLPRSKTHTESVKARKEQVDEVAEIQWYFPNELDEVPEILAQEGVIPHSGGTGILWGGMTRIRGLMDVSRLELKFCRIQDGTIDLGAALSYGETAAALAESGHLLSRTLCAAATEPLRNRISLGGSISMFPYWSDLMGPLLAHEAELSLAGATSGTRALGEYLQNRDLRKNTLITSIRLPDLPWEGAYYRHTRTPTDRPAFSITVLLKHSAKRIEEIRAVVVGCAGRYRRLTAVEKVLRGSEVPSDPSELLEEAAEQLDIDFPARMGFSAEYLNACAAVELKRTLASALGSVS
jgi:CO/xanthine dehydrogenase FAD-binding subunit